MTVGYLPLAEHLPVKPESLWRIAVAFNKLLIGRLNVITGVSGSGNAGDGACHRTLAMAGRSGGRSL